MDGLPKLREVEPVKSNFLRGHSAVGSDVLCLGAGTGARELVIGTQAGQQTPEMGPGTGSGIFSLLPRLLSLQIRIKGAPAVCIEAWIMQGIEE